MSCVSSTANAGNCVQIGGKVGKVALCLFFWLCNHLFEKNTLFNKEMGKEKAGLGYMVFYFNAPQGASHPRWRPLAR